MEKNELNKIREEIKQEYDIKRREDFAKALSQIAIDSVVTPRQATQFSTRYSKEDALKYLENPTRYEKELRNMSKALCAISPQYNRLISYFARLAVVAPVLVPVTDKINSKSSSKDKITKDYEKATTQLEKMNIKHEFLKTFTTLLREDVFYGYEFETNDSYYIKKMNPDYCKLATIEDGVYNYAFDFSYFDADKDGNLIKNYPSEFKSMYNKYLKNKRDMQWQILDGNKTACFKFNEDLEYAIPYFANVFSDLYDISDYKMLQKAKTEIDNYKLIGMEIPIRDNSDNVDDFLLDGNTVISYYQRMLSALPQGVGAFITPMPFKEITFAKQISDKNTVANAEATYWGATGVSDLLFGSGANTGGTLAYSVQTDEMLLFPIYRQLERWLNKKFKSLFGGKFKITLLDITRFNQQAVIDNLIKCSQFGVPVKTHLCSAVGLNPSEMMGLSILENDVLQLHEKWIPLSSSHTQSGTADDGGRPEKDPKELTDSGEQTREGK